MTLAEITTPYERRRVIEHSTKEDKPVRRWYEVQQIEETLYKSKEDEEDNTFILAVFFDDEYDGFCIFKSDVASDFTVDFAKAIWSLDGYTDIESMIARDREAMSGDYLISNEEIEFLRQYNPVFADTCAKHRADCCRRIQDECEALAKGGRENR